MSKYENLELNIRRVSPKDSFELLNLVKQLKEETNFVVFDDINISVEKEYFEIESIISSLNNEMFVASINSKIVGFIRISASSDIHFRHIGEIGIGVLKEYWNLGIGHLLMESAMEWSKHNKVIKRLELTVQKRNTKALRIYKEFGFKEEAIMEKGFFDQNEGFISVILMSKLVN